MQLKARWSDCTAKCGGAARRDLASARSSGSSSSQLSPHLDCSPWNNQSCSTRGDSYPVVHRWETESKEYAAARQPAALLQCLARLLKLWDHCASFATFAFVSQLGGKGTSLLFFFSPPSFSLSLSLLCKSGWC